MRSRVELTLHCNFPLPTSTLTGCIGCTEAAYQLPELSELSQQEVLIILIGHPVGVWTLGETCLDFVGRGIEELHLVRQVDVPLETLCILELFRSRHNNRDLLHGLGYVAIHGRDFTTRSPPMKTRLEHVCEIRHRRRSHAGEQRVSVEPL